MSPPDPILVAFTGGILTAGYLALALFFAQFWRRSRDPLFATFSVAFVLMAANQALPIIYDVAEENRAAFYLLRLFAFGLIIVAILRKNLAR
jgi:peptidoglycan/LPS O-acetylase OafA/YrhL